MKKTYFRLCAVFFLAAFLTAAAPDTPERQEFTADAGTPLSARLVLTMAEGERCVLTTAPAKGTVRLSADGSFLYTPDANRRGRDYFGYRVENAAGEFSEEATVLLRLNRPSV